MANILELQHDFDGAMENHKKSLEIAEELKNRDAVVKACASIASIAHTLDDNETALK